MQYPDGTLETDDDESPCIHIYICRDWGIPATDARGVAAAILAAAEEADQLMSDSIGTDSR
jgi:hypothetical protein